MKKTIWLLILVIIALVVLVLVGSFVDNKNKSQIKDSQTQEKQMENEEGAVVEGAVIKDGDYDIDTERSVITWTGRRPLLNREHTGTFSLSSGSVVVENGKVASGDFVIDMTSIKGDGTGVVNDLKSDNFFSIGAYPEATFSITSVDGNSFTGDLTIKGITNAVSFPAEISKTEDGINAKATLAVDRTLWDIRFGSGKFFSDVGDKIIDDDVSINLDIWTL